MEEYPITHGHKQNGAMQELLSPREEAGSMKLWLIMFVLLAILFLLAVAARGQVPRTISYQGALTNNGLSANGEHLITVSLYDSLTGGTLLYQESHEVTVINGTFNIEIGSITPIPATLPFDKPYYLGIAIDGAAELIPRVSLGAAPYALSAGTAQLAEGLVPGAHGLVTSINELAGPLRIIGDSNTSVTQNGNDIIIHSKATSATGIQSITSPDKTIDVSNSVGPNVSVGVADSAITSSKLSNGAVTPEKLAQAGARNGQILKWNGTNWAVANDSTVQYRAGQGISISNDTITAAGGLPFGTVLNSTLRWNGTNWVENPNMTSDGSGNTQINGATNLGNGTGADNITMSPGSGHVQVNGWSGGIVVSSSNGTLSTSQLAGSAGISITESAGAITIGDTGFGGGWALTGNSGTAPAKNYLGTIDDQPFEIHIFDNDGAAHGSKRVWRFEPNATSANVVGGYQGNAVTANAIGGTIAGGGLNGFNNTVTDDFGVVGGGSFNRAGNGSSSAQDASHATVAGGGGNTASGIYSSVLGGTGNTAGGVSAAVGGGSSNQASGAYATVTGGIANYADDTAAVVSGFSNYVHGSYSAISGGVQNSLTGSRSAIAGGGWLGMSGAGSFGFHNGSSVFDSAFVSAPGTVFFGNVNLWIGNTNNTAGQLRLYSPQDGGINFPAPITHYSSFSAPGQTADINYILPSAPPTSVQTLAATTVSGTGAGPYTVTLGWSNNNISAWNLTGNGNTTPGTNFLGTTDNRDLIIKTNANEVMRVTSAGFVGIGTSAPIDLLNVVSTNGGNAAQLENNNSATGLNQQAALVVTNLTTSAAPTEIAFGHGNSAAAVFGGATIDMIPANLTPGSEAGNLIFGTRTNGLSNVTEKMRLTYNGRLGIGTPTPSQEFEVANGNIILSHIVPGSDTLLFQGTGTGISSFTAGAQGPTTINYTLPTSQPLPNQVLSATSIVGTGPYNVMLGWTTGTGGAGGWNLTGNSGTTDGTDFLGTTDSVPFTIRTNNLQALRIQPAHTAPASVIGGTPGNMIAANDTASFIGFGDSNHISSSYASIIGGAQNTVTGDFSNITSSYGSVVSGEVSAIIAGEGNSISGDLSTIVGGYTDTITDWDGFIGGGSHDVVKDENGAIAGGELNVAYLNAFVGGGIANYAGAYSHSGEAVLGGAHNSAAGDNSVIAGGQDNQVPLSAIYSAVLAGVSNYAGGSNSAIVGGGYLRMSGNNSFGFHAGSSSTDSAAITQNNTAYFGNVNLWLGNTNNTPSQLRFYGAQNGGVNFPASGTHYSSFAAAGQTADINYTLPSNAPSANGNLLLASSGTSIAMAWSTNLVWDNTNSRLGINTASPMHSLHSVYSGTTDETAAIFGNATGSTTNQSIGVWGSATNTSTTNTGTIGMLATGNGNTSAGQTNVALQINDGEFAIGRTTQVPDKGSDVEAAMGGTAYSQQGPSGIVELSLGSAGDLATSAPTAGAIQDLGFVTINNRYCESGSIVLTNIVAMVDDGTAPNPQTAAWIINADNTAAGSFVIRIKMIPTITSASNFSTSDKIRIGYMIVNKSK